MHAAVFKCKVAAAVHYAVFKCQIFSIAQGLRTWNPAIDQPQVTWMPSEIFTVQLWVIHRYILAFPQCVFSGDPCIAKLHILDILEDIFAVAFQAVDAQIPAEHERICASMQLQVLYTDSATFPENFIRIVHLHILNVDFMHLTEHFGCINYGILHFQMVGIP